MAAEPRLAFSEEVDEEQVVMPLTEPKPIQVPVEEPVPA